MRVFEHPRVLWIMLIPAAVLLCAAWLARGVIDGRIHELELAAARHGEEISKRSAPSDPDAADRLLTSLREEADELRSIHVRSNALDQEALVRDHEGIAFQLIDFERERAAAAQIVRDQAKGANVRIEDSAFGVLADTSGTEVSNPRHRWAQLSIARSAASRAVSAGVSVYGALTVPAVREFRIEPDAPVIAEQVLFAVQVSGSSASVQRFIELLALGPEKDSLRFLIEHFVLRKDGVASPDSAAATIVFGALLSPTKMEAPALPASTP